jgi:hypothetical protein
MQGHQCDCGASATRADAGHWRCDACYRAWWYHQQQQTSGVKVKLITAQFAALTLGPDDVLVLWCEQHLSPEARANVRTLVRAQFPERRCLLLDGGLKLGVMRAGNQADEAVIIHGNIAAPEPGGVMQADAPERRAGDWPG